MTERFMVDRQMEIIAVVEGAANHSIHPYHMYMHNAVSLL
jgi:hypothetical protein